MSAFEFVSHEAFPEDSYIAEAVVFCIDGKHRVTYIRKKMKNGGMFWDVISASVKQHGESKFLKSYSQDSNFLGEDIKHFLESRSWEKNRKQVQDVELPF
jgi:hypothetical protein